MKLSPGRARPQPARTTTHAQRHPGGSFDRDLPGNRDGRRTGEAPADRV